VVKRQRLVVIGGVAAGTSAAAKAKRTDPELEVILLESGPFVSYGSCGMPAFIAGMIPSADELIARDPQEFARRGVEVRTQHQVAEVDAQNKSLRVADLLAGRDYSLWYDALIIATGASAVRPKLAGLDLDGVFVLRTLSDGLAISEALKTDRPSHVAIIGGGYVGLLMAAAFRAHDLPVTVVEMAPQLMVNLDSDMSALVLDEVRGHGVRVLLNDRLVRCEGRKRVEKVVTENEEIPADLVLLAIGVRPNVELAQQAGVQLGAGGAIAVDEHMRTNVAGVYAAGDCAEAVLQVTGERVYIPLGTTANKQGRVAGANVAGMDCTFEGIAGTAATKVFDLEVARTGLTEREAVAKGLPVHTSQITAKDRSGYYPGASRLDVKLVIDAHSRRLLGGQMIGASGAAKRIDVLAAAIYAKLTVDDLTHFDYSYTPSVASVWDATLIAANVTSRCK
jgi:NADPH-dependent 2,4-dienoyl-CoA reductase/sulfur reductase-like enzyme